MISVVQRYIEAIHADVRHNSAGVVADHLPDPPPVDAEAFGICLATQDGHVYEVGDTRAPFSMHSVSKPFTYALAIADCGLDAINAKIDVEPSGEAYDEASVDRSTRRPLNAMINAGAIMASSLVAGDTPAEQSERIRQFYSRVAGRELSLNEPVFTAELAAGHRNRSIGHLLRSFGVLETDPEDALAVYLRQCSVDVECRDLAMMAATLANGGIHPVSGEEVLDPLIVRQVLSVMTTCGMYDDAGEWVATVGLPAKSSVAGAIIAVLPGRLGIAVYSPRLDQHGNSVRGIEACRRLSQDLDLHVMHVTRSARTAIRAAYDLTAVASDAVRSDAERRILTERGSRGRVYELHGDLMFADAETVTRAITDQLGDLDVVVLDGSRVDAVVDVARSMLLDLLKALHDSGREGILVDPDGRFGDAGVAVGPPWIFTDLRSAVESCEDRLIARHGATTVPATAGSAPGPVETAAVRGREAGHRTSPDA